MGRYRDKDRRNAWKRAWSKAHRDKQNFWAKGRYDRKRDRGECSRCGLPAVGSLSMCAKHLQSYRDKSNRTNPVQKQKYIDARKCVRCGAPLEEQDGRTCFNCAHKDTRLMRLNYATNRI